MVILSDEFYYQPIRIDTINTRVFADIVAKEGDANGRGLLVTLTENGLMKDTTGIDLNLKWEHTSVGNQGLDNFEAVDLSRGLYKITYPTEMLNRGNVHAFIQILDGGKNAGSRNLEITVDRGVGDNTAIVSSNSFTALDQALIDVNNLESTYAPRLNSAEQQLADIDAQVDLLNRGLGETINSLALLNSTYPTGDTKDHIVAGNIAEVDTLTVTAIPTTAGNVTVTLNEVAKTVPVTIGVAEISSLTVTAIPTVAGNVTVTLNGINTTVAIDPLVETTIELVADKIRATAFAGWTNGGVGANVIFTATTVGVKTDIVYSAGATGATGTTSTTVQGVDAATTALVATAIRGTAFTGWTTGGTGSVVTFTATTTGARTAPIFAGGTTGVTATFAITVKGENANFHRYFWNGTAWADGGAYQAIEINDNSITTNKLTDTIPTVNAFSSTLELGVLNSVGVKVASVNFFVSKDYVPILPETNYATANDKNYLLRFAFFDSGFTFLSYVDGVSTFLTPPNAKYLLLSTYAVSGNNDLTTKIMLNAGTTALPYEAFRQPLIKQKYIEPLTSLAFGSVDTSALAEKSVIPSKTSFFDIGKNKFNKKTVTVGYYVNQTSGVLVANATHTVSDYIEVTPETYIIGNQLLQRYAFYDVNKVYLSGSTGSGGVSILCPINAKYLRVSSDSFDITTLQIEIGTVTTPFEDWEYVIGESNLPKKLIPEEPFFVSDLGKQYRVIGANIRTPLGAGMGFSILDDAGHEPMGITSVTIVGEELRVGMSFTATKVVSMSVVPHVSLMQEGYSVATTGGLSVHAVHFYKNGLRIPAGDVVINGGSFWFNGVFLV